MYARLAGSPRRGPDYAANARALIPFAAQVGLIVGVDLADELTRGLFTTVNIRLAEQHALHVMQFERQHGFWIEPGIQEFFERTHHLLGLTIGWAQLVPVFDALYGLGHVGITFLFALFIYLRRRAYFPFLRDVFLGTTLLTLAMYRLYPLAPPRLATGLRYDGRPYHFVDAVFGAGNGLRISFDEFAAMPSLHVAWALIVGLALAWTLRPTMARLAALCYPPLMAATVIATGNHYISDMLGALFVLSVATIVAVLLQMRRSRCASPLQAMAQLAQVRHVAPVAVANAE